MRSRLFARVASPLALLVLPFAVLTGACAQHGYAQGSVSYTSTPVTAEHSGALPLVALVCLDSSSTNYRRGARIQLGSSCTLAGVYDAHRGRGSSRGGIASLSADGTCALPTAGAPIPIDIETSTLEVNLDAVDVTVGGRTNEGRYLTYRFTGVLGDNDEDKQCDALLEPRR